MSFKKSVCNRISSSVTAVMQRKNKVVMAVAGATVASPAFADGFSKSGNAAGKGQNRAWWPFTGNSDYCLSVGGLQDSVRWKHTS